MLYESDYVSLSSKWNTLYPYVITYERRVNCSIYNRQNYLNIVIILFMRCVRQFAPIKGRSCSILLNVCWHPCLLSYLLNLDFYWRVNQFSWVKILNTATCWHVFNTFCNTSKRSAFGASLLEVLGAEPVWDIKIKCWNWSASCTVPHTNFLYHTSHKSALRSWQKAIRRKRIYMYMFFIVC